MQRDWRSEEEANRRPWFPVKNGCQFFQIIHSAIIKQMGLPKKFVRKFGNQLADVVVLKVPNDKTTWHVKLRKADGKIWLGKGWEKFVEYHSVSVGQFLVFRYDGNSNFHVLIFDMSGTEIHYQCNSHFSLEEPRDSEELHAVRESEIDEIDVDEAVEVLGVSPPKTEKAIESAKAFKSKHPFYVLLMRQSYVTNRYSLVPAEFVRSYMPKNSGSLMLKASNGRTWTVNYIRNGNHTRLTKGWRSFARENNLKIGDVCVFELINNVDFVMEVSIFRGGGAEM